MTDVLTDRPRRTGCSTWARSCGLSAAGSAMAAPGGVLLIEWPLPWPRDVREVPELAEVVDAADALDARVLLVADHGQPGDQHTVCWYRSRVADPLVVAGFEPVERRCRRPDVVETALALLAGGDGEADVAPADVVICTHGRRDTCCGGSGTSLYRALKAEQLPEGVRLWRSSHQGGHRFAPTALMLPDATCWAYLDVETVRGLVQRDLPPSAVIDHYRGCAGFADAQLQALDGAALAESGWRWADTTRTGHRLGPNQVELVAAGDGLGRVHGVVGVGETCRLPPCGSTNSADAPLTDHHSLEVMAYRYEGG